MAKIYIKKEEKEKGYNQFLTFIYRYIVFSNKLRFDNGTHMCISQKKVAAFLGKSKTTIYKYFKKAVYEDGFLTKEGTCIFKENQLYESNIYGFNLIALKKHLDSKGLNPTQDKEEAKTQYTAYIKSLHRKRKYKNENLSQEEIDEKEKRALARKRYRSNKLKKSFTHEHYNRVINGYNDRLEEMGKGEYKDSFLDEASFRASNDFCYTRNPKKHTDRPERVAELKKVGIVPADEYYECEFEKNDKNKPKNLHTGYELEKVYEKDTNGSIYRLTYNLNHDQQLSQDIDIYQLFWEAAGFEQPYSKEVKDNGLKMACMPIYMKEQGIKDCIKEFRRERKIREYNADKRLVVVEGYDNKEDSRYEAYAFLTSYTGLEIKEVLNRLCQAMHKVLGVEKFYGRDIFLYESELHADIKLQLLNKGIFVLNAFDGFFGKPDEFTKELFFEVYYNATENLKNVRRMDNMIKNETLEPA